jgi:TrkA-N domain
LAAEAILTPKREANPGESLASTQALRRFWRERVGPLWRDVRGVVLVLLGLLVLVLGTIGFEQYRLINYGFVDSIYRATTLFAFGGVVTPPVPAALQVARILAPILTGYAAVGTILVLSREQAKVLGIRLFARAHIIVAGLGASGSSLALALADSDARVVVLESDATNTRLAGARERGIGALIGDATDPALLRKAGIRHARYVVALCGSDGTNVDVAAAVAVSLEKRATALTVFAHLGDLDLWRSLNEDAATFGTHPQGVRFEFFNVYATAAQMLLEGHPPFQPTKERHDARAARRRTDGGREGGLCRRGAARRSARKNCPPASAAHTPGTRAR